MESCLDRRQQWSDGMTEILDISIPTLMAACKGNVADLPSFCVHDDAVWPNWRRVQLDSRGRIHLRRSTFLREVAGRLPVVAGLWLRADMQEFRLDLRPHHLQGSYGMERQNSHRHLRAVTRVDAAGRPTTDPDHGQAHSLPARQPDVERDLRAARAAGEAVVVRSRVLD